jgi:hypothetical protein
VSVIENPEAARSRGVRRYPALAHEDEVLEKLFLTRRRIRRFLERIPAGTA